MYKYKEAEVWKRASEKALVGNMYSFFCLACARACAYSAVALPLSLSLSMYIHGYIDTADG